MSNRFRNILIPVDFSINTEVAIAKALALCKDDPSVIHLLHINQTVVTSSLHYLHHYTTGHTAKDAAEMNSLSEASLTVLKNDIEKRSPHSTVLTWTIFDEPVEEVIIKKANLLKVDLIIIGKHSNHSIFPFLNTIVTNRVAAQSKVPVLVVKPGSLYREIKTVVIPVGQHFPAKKLELLEALRWKSAIHVRLVSFHMEEGDTSRQSLLNVFRVLKNQFFHAVGFDMLGGTNKARALLKYCNKIGADLMIVYPYKETSVDSWTGRHISDLLPASSGTQVLSV